MNNYILNLIKEAVNSEKEKNVDRVYRIIWISILERFKQNPNEDILTLTILKMPNNYYNIIYHGDKKITETTLEIANNEKDILKAMLASDGFDIDGSRISIKREKIISYASKTKETNKNIAVPDFPVNMIDEYKIKRNKC